MSVLPKNRQLVCSIRNYIRDPKFRIFHILAREDIDDVMVLKKILAALQWRRGLSNSQKKKELSAKSKKMLTQNGKPNMT